MHACMYVDIFCLAGQESRAAIRSLDCVAHTVHANCERHKCTIYGSVRLGGCWGFGFGYISDVENAYWI